jgi:hypothetical protein
MLQAKLPSPQSARGKLLDQLLRFPSAPVSLTFPIPTLFSHASTSACFPPEK